MISLTAIPTILMILIVALPVTFIAMNPAGALDIVMTTGQFIMITIMDIIKGGMAALWWLFQAIYTGVANLLIGAGNLVIAAINNFFSSLVAGWQPMKQFTYLEPPPVTPTIQAIIDEIVDGYTNLRVKISDYWSTVQANAPMSYVAGGVAGGGSAGATYLLTKTEETVTRPKTTKTKKSSKTETYKEIVEEREKQSYAAQGKTTYGIPEKGLTPEQKRKLR